MKDSGVEPPSVITTEEEQGNPARGSYQRLVQNIIGSGDENHLCEQRKRGDKIRGQGDGLSKGKRSLTDSNLCHLANLLPDSHIGESLLHLVIISSGSCSTFKRTEHNRTERERERDQSVRSVRCPESPHTLILRLS